MLIVILVCTYVCYVSGKSSLLRALAGLWRVGSGTIYATWYEISRNGHNSDLSGNNNMKFQQVFFLPQKPYNIIGIYIMLIFIIYLFIYLCLCICLYMFIYNR